MTDRELMQRALEALVYHVEQTRPIAQPDAVMGTKTWFEDGKVVTQYLTAADIYIAPQRVREG